MRLCNAVPKTWSFWLVVLTYMIVAGNAESERARRERERERERERDFDALVMMLLEPWLLLLLHSLQQFRG